MRSTDTDFPENGIDSSRVDLMPLIAQTHDHLSAYSLMDLSLDPFPYAGTTTTCEALWMGIPVVTLRGGCHAANVGVSLLSQVSAKCFYSLILQIEGHSRFVASDLSDYIRIAVELANDIPLLTACILSFLFLISFRR
jgi:predicted O-linked N-acetylglucosamine transferase (SPINDLY family)